MEGNGDGLKEGRLGLEGRRNGAVGFRVRVWESGGLEEGLFRSFIPHRAFTHFSSVLTIDLTLSFFRSVYDWPHPTNITGAPDMYTIDNAAPTLSSIVSNLVSRIPSINLGVGEVERSANF